MYGELISSVTVGAGGASSIDFTSIPGTYTDLCIVVSARSANADVSDWLLVSFNGSTSSFTTRTLIGDTGSVDSYTLANRLGFINGNSATANTFGSMAVYIPNYAGSTNKSYSVEAVNETNSSSAGNSGRQTIVAGNWANTAAITSISLLQFGGTIQQYSTAYLYGLTKGSGGATVS